MLTLALVIILGCIVLALSISIVCYCQKRTSTKQQPEPTPLGLLKEATLDFLVPSSEIEFGKLLGKGSQGEVFQAKWRSLELAVKKIDIDKVDPAIIDEFCQEANIMRQLRHPNLTLFLGVCLEDPTICILTEFVARGSLFDLLHDDHAPFTWQRGLRILCDVAQGMTYLHAAKPRPILHRDLKSLNILVDENWRGKVADFGMSRFHDAGATMTQCGSPLWMAPEMVRNLAYDEKSDVYSFGICLWEIYTRKIPYRNLGLAPSALVVKVVKEHLRPQIPPTVLKPYQKLIERCWHPNPEKRPVFSKIVEALEAFLLDPTVMAHTPGSTRQGVMLPRTVSAATPTAQSRTMMVNANDRSTATALAESITQSDKSWFIENWESAVLVDNMLANDREFAFALKQELTLSNTQPYEQKVSTVLSPISTSVNLQEREGKRSLSRSYSSRRNSGEVYASESPWLAQRAVATDSNLPTLSTVSIQNQSLLSSMTTAGGATVTRQCLPEFWPDCYFGKYRDQLVLVRKMIFRAPGAPTILIQQLQERKQTHQKQFQEQAFQLRQHPSFRGANADSMSPQHNLNTSQHKSQMHTLTTTTENLNDFEFSSPCSQSSTLPPGQQRLSNISEDQALVEQIKDALAQCAGLRHPNLTMFMGGYIAPTHVGMIHELPAQGTLQGLLLDQSVLIDWDTSISILIDIAQVMTYLYSCRPPQVPQDLSSASFLVDSNWRVKLLNPLFSSLDQFIYGGHTVPTPWSAPETLEHASMITPASHVYSFAIIMWQLFARRPVYNSQWDGRTLRAVAHDALRPKVPSSMPATLVNLLTSCWSEKPQQRPTFPEILASLRQLRDDGPPKMTLILGINAERYRKATTVFAYKSSDPITILKDWGKSVGNAGDYVVQSTGDDVYVIDADLFKRTYEPVRGSAHEYRKVGSVLARQMEEPFVVKTGAATEFGYVGDYLVQNASGDQWVVEGKTFRTLYELDSTPGLEQNTNYNNTSKSRAHTPRSPISGSLAVSGSMTFQEHATRPNFGQQSMFTFSLKEHSVKE